MSLILRHATARTPEHYEDQETKQTWRRIVGGIGWPRGDNPGVGLVLCEDLEHPPNYKVVVEVKDYNALTLLEKCKAIETSWPVGAWHGNPNDAAMMLLLHDSNKGKEPKDRLRFKSAPLAGEINNSGYYLPKIIEMFRVGVDRLDVGITEVLLRDCQGIRPESHLNRDIGEFPSLAALSYPLSYLLLYGPVDKSEMRPLKAVGWML